MNATEMKQYLQALCSDLSKKAALLAAVSVGFPAGVALAGGDDAVDLYAGPPVMDEPIDEPPAKPEPEKPADVKPQFAPPSPDDAVALYAGPPVPPGPDGLGIAPRPQETPPDADKPAPQQPSEGDKQADEQKDGKKAKLKIPPIKPVRPPLDHVIALYAAPPLLPPQNRDQKK